MSSLAVKLFTLLGVTKLALKVSGTEVDLMVKPGSNVTLHSDCIWTSGKQMYWHRNCSHYRQPSLVIKTIFSYMENSCYQYKWNSTSQSHDLLIKNITESELGVYYCSVAETTVVDETVIQQKVLYSFGNITYKLAFEDPKEPTCPPAPDCGLFRMLLVSLCPFSALVSALMALLCMHVLWAKTGSFQEHERKKGGGFQVGVSLQYQGVMSLRDVGDVYTEVIYKRQ